MEGLAGMAEVERLGEVGTDEEDLVCAVVRMHPVQHDVQLQSRSKVLIFSGKAALKLDLPTICI